MTPGLVVKLRPTTPWRTGSESGTREQVEPIYHSDSLYSAITGAMASLGGLEEWLEATARNPQGSAVSFSSLFPFVGEVGFIIPPRSVWPPAPSARIRWKSARFIPIPLVEALLKGRTADDERWTIDGASGCLIPAGGHGPFRPAVRCRGALDRLEAHIDVHQSACLEFAADAGLWAIVEFADEPARDRWLGPVEGAFRLLADSGFGGGRSMGWGRAQTPEFAEGVLPQMIMAVDWRRPVEPAAQAASEAEPPRVPDSAYWLLSLYAPGSGDSVDWSRGSYSVLSRSGRVLSAAGSGELKKSQQMVEEGSVLVAASVPRGGASDVAPEGFAHPVYRAGFAVSVAIPWRGPANHRHAAAAKPAPKPAAEGVTVETPSPEVAPPHEPVSALQAETPPLKAAISEPAAVEALPAEPSPGASAAPPEPQMLPEEAAVQEAAAMETRPAETSPEVTAAPPEPQMPPQEGARSQAAPVEAPPAEPSPGQLPLHPNHRCRWRKPLLQSRPRLKRRPRSLRPKRLPLRPNRRCRRSQQRKPMRPSQ